MLFLYFNKPKPLIELPTCKVSAAIAAGIAESAASPVEVLDFAIWATNTDAVVLRKKSLAFGAEQSCGRSFPARPANLSENFIKSRVMRLLGNMRDLMQQRFEELRLAMLDCHRKRYADCVSSFVVITACRPVAKDYFRH